MELEPQVVALSVDECRQLLATGGIGRVVLSMDALPAALPVSYRLVDDGVVFRSAPGSKLAAALRGSVVGFEVDAYDEVERTGWSVLAVGTSRVVSDPYEIARLDGVGLRRWVSDRDGSSYVVIEIGLLTGRRIVRVGPPEAESESGPELDAEFEPETEFEPEAESELEPEGRPEATPDPA